MLRLLQVLDHKNICMYVGKKKSQTFGSEILIDHILEQRLKILMLALKLQNYIYFL